MTTRIDVRLKSPETGVLLRVQPRVDADQRTAEDMARMLRDLWREPRYRELVTEVAHGRRDIVHVYEKYRVSDLQSLAPVFEDRELEGLIDEWLPQLETSDSHKARVRQCFKALSAETRRKARVSDLPALVREYRARCVTAKTPRAFNYAKMAAQALLRDQVGRRHPLWLAVADTKRMAEKRDGVKALSVEQALAVREKLTQLALHPHGRPAPDYSVG